MKGVHVCNLEIFYCQKSSNGRKITIFFLELGPQRPLLVSENIFSQNVTLVVEIYFVKVKIYRPNIYKIYCYLWVTEVEEAYTGQCNDK